MRSRPLVLRLLLFFSCIRLGSAQPCRPAYVIVTAFDEQGRALENLGASDLKASYRKRPLEVLSASFRKDPSFRAIVLLDVSGSMAGRSRGPDKWKIARAAAQEFVSSAPSQAQLSLWTFDAQVDHRADGLRAIEDRLNAEGLPEEKITRRNTVVYSTILDAIKGLEPAHPGDAIYVITDGRDTTSAESRSRVAVELQSSGVRLFAFLLSDAGRSYYVSSELYDLARASGGLAFNLKEETAGTGWAGSGFAPHYDYEKAAGFARKTALWVGAAIVDFYILTVSAREGTSDDEGWDLEIVDKQGKKRKDVVLAYPAKLQGCRAESTRH